MYIMVKGRFMIACAVCMLVGYVETFAYNPPERIMVVRPTFEDQTERVLRYQPDQTDFVIKNGTESFNRPLYGGNTAFRIDAGDVPEFSFYLPRHGGVVRFGIKTDKGVKWLLDADSIASRYRPGSMIYEINDPLLNDAQLRLTVLGLYDTEGMIAKAEINGDRQVELIVAYGGIGGRKGKRSGDIGCEQEPVSRFFQLKPEYCKDNTITIEGASSFRIESKFADFTGAFSQQTILSAANANHWNALDKLIASAGQQTDMPLLVGRTMLSPKEPVYVALQRNKETLAVIASDTLSQLYDNSQKQRKQIAERVSVETPDAFINAAASALCVAADAIWDESQGSVMHGAVAWRSKYLGWRGPYANDVLGWHDRSRRHLAYWATHQNTTPVPAAILPADPKAHLARNEPSLHSSGDMSGKHYDMNLVYMDALFRHILWTGDLDLAGDLWPVIERHMAWERRLFRRPFGDDQLPLYEAYAAIWASDDLQYHGGGVTHTSAYNYYHNRMVAQLAKQLGKDSNSYEKEAELILKGMQKYLWLADRGWYGEWKDLLGEQSVHPAAALWTFYHTIDSEVPTPMQAWQMSRFVDTQIAHIPVYGGKIPRGQYDTLPTSSWMPYTWSTNNVVMAEVAHTALAYWQAQRPDKAFALFKGCILDNMYMGKCPGNAGMTTCFDMARGEAQRDFGDAVGTCSRALIEGLFGIKPNRLTNQLTIKPGFPDEWSHAKLDHPDIFFEYQRDDKVETYDVKPKFAVPQSLKLRLKARGNEVQSVTVNGEPATWACVKEAVGHPYIEINCETSPGFDVKVEWKGKCLEKISSPPVVARRSEIRVDCDDAMLDSISDPQNALSDIEKQSKSFKAVTIGKPGHRTVFARLQQRQMQWAQPIEFEIRPPFVLIADAKQQSDSIGFRIQNNTPEKINMLAMLQVGNQRAEMPLNIPADGLSKQINLPATDFPLLPGSNRVEIDLSNGPSFSGIVTNWHVTPQAGTSQYAPVNLSSYYNDRITQIFHNEYLTPRSPYCSLAIPKQGIGSWCNFAKTFDVDDSGLRSAAQKKNGLFVLPQGVQFKIPAEENADNVVFTSQWDNYPNEVAIGLTGKARHLYLLMAGSTNSMQSQFDNGVVTITYKDGTAETLSLRNPTTWWPIDQDYFIDDFGFKRPEAIPPRVDLKTGKVRVLDITEFKGKGTTVPGGAATVLDLPLNPEKELDALKVHTLANEVIIGLMSATLLR